MRGVARFGTRFAKATNWSPIYSGNVESCDGTKSGWLYNASLSSKQAIRSKKHAIGRRGREAERGVL
jgi:hypothetical protein